VPTRQLHLLEPRKPLLERLGKEFFGAAPRKPGVYIMTGQSERVLYIGQSGNLRARLGSYKNARRDRAPRKIVRLVHLVESITYETCATAEAAILRESELLLLHRPKFNSMGVFPKKLKFIQVETSVAEMNLCFKTEKSKAGFCYGPFKGDVLASFGALCRTLWVAVKGSTTLEDFPARMLTQPPAKEVSLQFPDARFHTEGGIAALNEFLSGKSDQLLASLTAALPSADLLSPFQRALHAQDIETLQEFYARLSGNKKGREILNPPPGG
jgi:excinuclease UvrABC nuclease subunit